MGEPETPTRRDQGPAEGSLEEAVTVSFAIQTHPARAELAVGLAAILPGAELVVDPDPTGGPNPWRCYRACLERTPSWATHRLVIQDDALLCLNFNETVERIARAQPDRLVALFVPGRLRQHVAAVMDACQRDALYCELQNGSWCPAVCNLWPASFVEPFLAYVDAQRWPEQFTADDEIIGRWLTGTDQRALACVPSLVEHEDMAPSLVGSRAFRREDPGRIAACWFGIDCDPLDRWPDV